MHPQESVTLTSNKPTSSASNMPKVVEWTDELESAILSDVEAGLSLRATAEKHGISKALILKKARDVEFFRDHYARAKEIQLDHMAEEIISIADSADKEDHQVARLRVDTRKWLLSKLVPKKYGDRVEQFISGPDGAPIQAAITVEFVKAAKSGTDISNE